MTRKHYIELAKIIGQAQGAAEINQHAMIDEDGHASWAITSLTEHLLVLLKDENPNFDGNRFIKAVSKEAQDLVDEVRSTNLTLA
mgnify:FL=1